MAESPQNTNSDATDTKQGESVGSIVLGIFVGISATLSLQRFLELNVPSWIGTSIGVIIFSVFLIYLMIDDVGVEKYKASEIMRMLSIIFITFFPFSLQKAVGNYSNNLPMWGLAIHILLGGIFLLLWGHFDKDLDKQKRIVGNVLGFLLVIAGLVWFLVEVG